jgi:hypothetical protein
MLLKKDEVIPESRLERVQIPFKANRDLKDKLDLVSKELVVSRQGLIEQILIKNLTSLLEEINNGD